MKKYSLNKLYKKKTNLFSVIQPTTSKFNNANINKNLITKIFHNQSVLLFRNFNFNEKNIFTFANKFTHSYAPDAPRRNSKFNNNKIKSVDIGNNEIELHSEGSFTSVWPEIIWFYCKSPPKKSGFTLLCDGSKLWESLSQPSKEFFLFNELIYDVEIPFKKNPKIKKLQKWYLNALGSGDCYIDWQKGIIKYKQKRYAVNYDKKFDKFFFTNHLLLNLKLEPQLKTIKYNKTKSIPKKIIDEIILKSEDYKFNFMMKKNDLIMINNKHFLHGRTNINKDEKREIAIIQTLRKNF